jgi:hypothetical protein
MEKRGKMPQPLEFSTVKAQIESYKLPYKPRVVIGISAKDRTETLFVKHLEELRKLYGEYIEDTIWDFLKPVDFSRNALFGKFLIEYPYATHLWILDDDVMVPNEGLMRLLEGNHAIVSGVVVQKAPPFYPLVNMRVAPNSYRFALSWDSKERWVNADSVGFGCMLIRRDVAQTITPPWAKTQGQSEDYYFGEKAQSFGFPIKVDMTVNTGHLGMYGFSIMDFKQFQGSEIAKSQSLNIKTQQAAES